MSSYKLKIHRRNAKKISPKQITFDTTRKKERKRRINKNLEKKSGENRRKEFNKNPIYPNI